MGLISEVADQELVWVKPRRGRDDYELRAEAGDDVIGSLHFTRRTEAEAVAEGLSWRFKRQGFWRQHVIIEPAAASTTPLVLRMNMRGNRGQLDVPAGRTFRLAFRKFWKPEGRWTEGDQRLIPSRPAAFGGKLPRSLSNLAPGISAMFRSSFWWVISASGSGPPIWRTLPPRDHQRELAAGNHACAASRISCV